MGNREDLLDGARKAILERGLAKVTARDIATAAGVSLAAIGYHFGSKEQLITQALTEGLGGGIGDRMDEVIRAGEHPLSHGMGEIWTRLLAILRDNREGMTLSMEHLVRVARSEQSRAYMAEASEHAYADLTRSLRDTYPDLTDEQARALGKLVFTLFQGVAVLWLAAPDLELLDGADLTTAVEALNSL
ncbi:TetR/AcrR family transcriptional regulator [Nocardia takedensis]|uniref:TetR/AcrR family transcriptional regulator n=1 Tax=Nocardia takedensis TaxID=259390 RepID=UPI0003087E60|nr:TetR/AcrR family transcriptional regulator [Nocardia takedensis]